MITFKEFILEVFDSPHKINRDLEMEDKVREHLTQHPTHKPLNYGAIKAYKMEGDDSHLIHAIRDGKHELHHIASNHESGENKPRISTPNPKFIGTFYHYFKDNIEPKGHIAKISSTDKMYPHLKPIVDRIAKKNGNVVSYGSEKVGNETLYHTLIHPKKYKHPMFENMV